MEPKNESLAEGNGGWVRYQSDSLSNVPVFVRLEDRDGRLVPVDVFITAIDGSIDTTVLRSIPMGRIEAWVNAPVPAEGIRARLPLPGPDLRRAASYFSTTIGALARKTWVSRMLSAQVKHSEEEQPAMLDLATHPSPLIIDIEDVNALLAMPEGRSYGEDFYRTVAGLYAQLARRTRNPVTTIATANEVPLSTVQRWIREARRRGFLPAAQSGKRG